MSEPITELLWPDGAPGSEHWTHHEIEFPDEQGSRPLLRNVTAPRIEVFRPAPERANGEALVIFPGGGYHFLAMNHEGYDVARWAAERGITAVVATYRLLQTPDAHEDYVAWNAFIDQPENWKKYPEQVAPVLPLCIADGLRAVEMVRSHAEEWGIERVGVMGFSAGGGVALGTALAPQADARPDYVADIYGVNPPLVLDGRTPPLFAVAAVDDPTVPVDQPEQAVRAWREAERPVEAHFFTVGGHGFGMRRQGLPSDVWVDLFGAWLDALPR